jgi:glycosyltransferase involved in cell wall biosynthesis
MTSISVVIPSSGDLQYVESLVQSMADCLQMYCLEIIIVCNPAKLEMNTILSRFPSLNITVMQTDVIGVNHARQMGLVKATHQYVLFLDDDCRFTDSDQVTKIFVEILNHPDLFAVGGYYSSTNFHLNRVARAYAKNQMSWLKQGLIDSTEKLNAYLIGGFFIMNKAIASQYRLCFDEAMIFGGTEKDFFLRAYQLGLRMRLLDISIEHDYPDVRFSYLIKVYKQGRGLRYINDKGLSFDSKYLDLSEKNKLAILFDVIFWSGYYLSKNEYVRYLQYLLKKMSDSLNEKKLLFLNKLKKHL